MADPMLHIASAVLKARPEDQAKVADSIAALPGAELHGAEGGRLIVVLEADERAAIAGLLDQLATLDGVLSATLVFEYAEPLGEMHEPS
ncbi:MAG: chaperone NapD [Rhodopila sp.]